ncbi:N,N-dimethylformamidase beta subunit family domain-containing protein [Methylobacterium sp. Leaf117]|uniref:N,N-dimethylformamidase beta subunit family domain-containing protein n=1 Tax=Methylobacterium sp. Leaf117 TaxID=1736260 RepID=UPI000701F2AA|nr:N,N-dimethylformamidase beta subunit family domain-containing protein [Methylobacterium sp. Leaf117]KQP87258.1 hypothetical protein ASF57_24060 [Methylobacterium sp. Leaf117]
MAENRIALENQKQGTARAVWDAPASSQIEGFTTDISYDIGQTVAFKINVNASPADEVPYQVEIYRLGYYGGDGATLVTSFKNNDGTVQPNPIKDSRGLVDAGNWSVTDSWSIPADVVSGVYLAKVQRLDASGNPIQGATNQIPFIVRDDTPADGTKSDIVLQTSDTTWQAYNGWGGNNGQIAGNFYGGFDQPDGQTTDPGPFNQDRAYAVSYNRPILTRDGGGAAAGAQDYLFGADYAAIHWLERNGYDVSYISGVDTDRLGPDALIGHKAYISVGHDEYWSGGQRANVEAARDAGVNLLFWSGNEMYWKTRYEDSIDGTGTDYRTLVSYKETWANNSLNAGPADYANIDPSSEWTGTWRDLRFVNAKDANGNPIASGALPENELTGQLFGPDGNSEGAALDVPAPFAGLRMWRDTEVAQTGKLDMAPGILGYEWDTSPEDEYRPAGLIKLSETTVPWPAIVTDQGNRESPGIATHNLSLYRDPESGALVFGAGTVFWSWALSDEHDSSPYGGNLENTAIQQFTVNMFADMGIQPAVADAFLTSWGLRRATASSDSVAATTTLTDLPDSVAARQVVTITGTATDNDGNTATTDGRVAAVEVSLDNGATWRVAEGTTNWSYEWRPTMEGTYRVMSRAIDDSLNVAQAPASTDTVQVTAPIRPDTFSLFDDTTPINATLNNDSGAANGLTLGMKFMTTEAGQITQLRYYRDAADANDTDVREGNLWGPNGEVVATATFTSGVNASGWQVATLSSPVSVLANAEYIVSYRTTNNYVATNGFFDPNREQTYDGIDNDAFSEPFGVLSAPQSVVSSGASLDGNGVFHYGSGTVFPNNTFSASNYWVDVTFDPTDGASNEPPVFTSPTAFSLAENRLQAGTVSATDPNGNALSYAISGGADSVLFTINAVTGALSFKAAPNFEAPTDAGANNVYDVGVSASDGIAPPVQQAVAVTVTDVAEGLGFGFNGATLQAQYLFDNDGAYNPPGVLGDTRTEVAVDGGGPEIEALAEQAGNPGEVGNDGLGLVDINFENSRIVYTFPVSSSLPQPLKFVPNAFNGPIISDVGDALRSIVSATLVSQSGFVGDPNGIEQSDILVTPDSIYLYVGGTQRSNGATVEVEVTFANEIPVITGGETRSVSVDENQTAVATITVTDADAVDSKTFKITGGEDAALFDIDASTGELVFRSPPDTENLPSQGTTPGFQVQVQVADAYGGADTQTIAVTVKDVNDVAPTVTSAATASVPENTTAVLTLTSSDPDTVGGPISYSLVTGANAAADNALFQIVDGKLSFISAPDFEGTHVPGYTVNVQAFDGINTTVQTIAVTVTDVPDGPVNTAPVGANDAFTASEDTALVVAAANGVLANGPSIPRQSVPMMRSPRARTQRSWLRRPTECSPTTPMLTVIRLPLPW